MSKLTELENLFENEINSYVSGNTGVVSEVNANKIVQESMNAVHEPAYLFAAGEVTEDEFQDLVNSNLRNAHLVAFEMEGAGVLHAEKVGEDIAKIVIKATEDFLGRNILVNVDPDDPWPRK